MNHVVVKKKDTQTRDKPFRRGGDTDVALDIIENLHAQQGILGVGGIQGVVGDIEPASCS